MPLPGERAVRVARAVVFDLDGTLVDSRDDIVLAVRFTLAQHGMASLDGDEIAGYVGDGARLLLARSTRLASTDARLDGVLATFLAYYSEHAADRTRLMPHAAATLDALSRLPLPRAICTNKPRPATDLVLAHLELTGRFDVVVAGGDLTANKPDPLLLHHIAARLGLSATDLAMVGDGVQDIECGRAAGAYTVAVTGGFASESQLRAAQPDALIESLAELPALLAARRD